MTKPKAIDSNKLVAFGLIFCETGALSAELQSLSGQQNLLGTKVLSHNQNGLAETQSPVYLAISEAFLWLEDQYPSLKRMVLTALSQSVSMSVLSVVKKSVSDHPSTFM